MTPLSILMILKAKLVKSENGREPFLFTNGFLYEFNSSSASFRLTYSTYQSKDKAKTKRYKRLLNRELFPAATSELAAKTDPSLSPFTSASAPWVFALTVNS